LRRLLATSLVPPSLLGAAAPLLLALLLVIEARQGISCSCFDVHSQCACAPRIDVHLRQASSPPQGQIHAVSEAGGGSEHARGPERRALDAAFTTDNEYVAQVLRERPEDEIHWHLASAW
jgi:hypothetical protein